MEKVAALFTDEFIGNETGWTGPEWPSEFLDICARRLVDNPHLGWPDWDSAREFINELGYDGSRA